jgi:hypothetical protein
MGSTYKTAIFIENVEFETSFGSKFFPLTVEKNKAMWDGEPKLHVVFTVIPVIKDENGPENARLAFNHRRVLPAQQVIKMDGTLTPTVQKIVDSSRGYSKKNFAGSNKSPFEQDSDEQIAIEVIEKMKQKFVSILYDLDTNKYILSTVGKVQGGSVAYEHLIPKPMFDDETPEEVHQ